MSSVHHRFQLTEQPSLADTAKGVSEQQVACPRWRREPPTADEVRARPYWFFRGRATKETGYTAEPGDDMGVFIGKWSFNLADGRIGLHLGDWSTYVDELDGEWAPVDEPL